MTNPAADEGSDYNTQIINEFRANGGRVGGPWAGTTLILQIICAFAGTSASVSVKAPNRRSGAFLTWLAVLRQSLVSGQGQGEVEVDYVLPADPEAPSRTRSHGNQRGVLLSSDGRAGRPGSSGRRRRRRPCG